MDSTGTKAGNQPVYIEGGTMSVSRTASNTGKTPGVDALFSCAGSGEPDSSYV